MVNGSPNIPDVALIDAPVTVGGVANNPGVGGGPTVGTGVGVGVITGVGVPNHPSLDFADQPGIRGSGICHA